MFDTDILKFSREN